MSARSERPKKRRIRVVGGGFRLSRGSDGKAKGSSAKSMRRALRRRSKDKKLTPEARRAAKMAVREMLLAKNARRGG